MSNFPESFNDYITIKSDGVFVGGKPTAQYVNTEIRSLPDVISGLSHIKNFCTDVREMHVLSSITQRGDYVYGNPSMQHGEHAWCRLVFKDNRFCPWFYIAMYRSKEICVAECACDSINRIRYNTGFRAKMCDKDFGLKVFVNALEEKEIDLSVLVGKQLELNGFRIAVNRNIQKIK